MTHRGSGSGRAAVKRTTVLAAGAFLVGGVTYLAAEAVAALGWTDRPYSYARNNISDLGIPDISPLHAVMNTGFMCLFPLIFLSNIFVEPETLPSVLEAFVDVNPISHLVTATRGLMEGDADAGEIGLVLATAAAMTAVFVPLTTRLYRRA